MDNLQLEFADRLVGLLANASSKLMPPGQALEAALAACFSFAQRNGVSATSLALQLENIAGEMAERAAELDALPEQH